MIKQWVDYYTEKYHALEMKRGKLNYINGVKVSLLSTIKYAKQYADADNFEYLFSGNEYWSVPGFDIYSDKSRFSVDGKYIESVEEYFNISYGGIIIPNEAVDFLKNEKNIQELLIEKGESVVLKTKLFCFSPSLTFLFIECPKNHYLIKLYSNSGSGEMLTNIEKYKLYLSDEIFLSILDKNEYTYIYRQTVTNNILKEKPTYETEATALQSNGLLNGTEKGLDLLKPLTRAEAAAILIRAMGQTEDAPDNSTQTFSDVPKTFWGYGATEKAYSLGIVAGIGDNLFAPNEDVTAEQFSTMVLRAANEHDFDWEQAVNILVEKGVLTQEQTKTMDFFTRGDMAKIIYEARQNGMF